MKKIFVIVASALILLPGCNRKETNPSQELRISTLQARNIFHDRAVIQGMYSGAEVEIVKCGFEFGQSDAGMETIYAEDFADGRFSCHVADLQTASDYVVSAFVTLADGKTLRGDRVCFTTSRFHIDEPSAPAGSATVLNGKQVLIGERPGSLGNSKLTPADAQNVTVKIAEMGVYYWPEDAGREVARKYVIEEAFANQKSTTDVTEYMVSGLVPGTRYCYVPYIKTGAYYYNNVWTAYSEEVEGDEGSFETMVLVQPSAVTNEGTSITATSFVGTAKLEGDGNDPDVKFGIEVGKTSESFETRVYASSLTNESLRTYVAFVKDLEPVTTYYFRAFAENDVYSAGSSIVKSFKTDERGVPVLDNYVIPYDQRILTFTRSKVVLRAKMLSNGGQDVTSQGFYYGSRPDALEQKVEASGELKSDGTYDYFEAEISGLAQGVVYYKPFAVNASGESVLEELCQISTVVGGGFQYVFDKTLGNVPMYNNMVFSANELSYLELDPIVNGEVTYYMLDRNIGASIPYDKSFYTNVFDTDISCPKLFDAAGYYYQFNRNKPSATPDVKIVSNMGSEPYNWTKTESYFVNPGLKAAEWQVDNCPEGYVMPTSDDFKAIVSAVAQDRQNQTLVNLFPATRFGITGARAPANGNMTASTASSNTVEFWTKNADSDGNTANVVRIKAGPAGTFEVAKANVFTGRPIRCIRKVDTTSVE